MARRSRYAEKRERGEQMYGPGCCAHSVTPSQVERARQAATERGHFAKTSRRREE